MTIEETKAKYRRVPCYTIFASNVVRPDGKVINQAIHSFATLEEAERCIESGECDHWYMTGESARLYIVKTWTLEDYTHLKV